MYNVGINPDMDYLLDPQMKDAHKFDDCTICGRGIYMGDSFIRFFSGRSIVTLCDRCAMTMESGIAGEEGMD